MEPQKASKKLILTSVNQLIYLTQTQPEIKNAVPKLAQISQMVPSIAPKKSCNCGSKTNFTTPDANKQVAENVLSSLTSEDFQQIKNVLNLDSLCYYKRENNKLEMVCV